jgi:hypothetical protein
MPTRTTTEASAVKAPYPRFVPIPRWQDYFDWPPPGGLRHLRFNADRNGFRDAFKKVGSRVLVDTEEFWRVVQAQGVRR